MAGIRGRRNARICDNNHLADPGSTITVPADPAYPFSNALNGKDRGKVWKPGTQTFTITIDFHYNKKCSFFALFGECDKPIKVSDEAVITLRANMINLFTGGEPFVKSVPVTDRGVFADLCDNDNLKGQEYRFWRIEIDDSANPNPIDVSYIFLGDHVDFTFNANQGFEFRQNDLSRLATSDSGMVYTARKNQYNSFSAIGFSYLTPEDRKLIEQCAERLGMTVPWVFVLDPMEIGFDLEFGTLLCYWLEFPQFTHAYLNKFNLRFTIREVV